MSQPDYSRECLTPGERNPSLGWPAQIPHTKVPMRPLESHLASAAGSLRFVVRACESADLYMSVEQQRDLLLQTCKDVAEHLDGQRV